MATHLDLEEQEQLDAVKRFWKRFGNLIVGLLIAVLACFSAWNGWNWWQRDQAAKAALEWVGANAAETEYQTIAKLRLAGLLLDAKQYEEALKQLDSATAEGFDTLVQDRRGDVLFAQGKTDEAKTAYKKAWQAMDPKIEYRRLIEAKLTSLGSPPEAASAASAGASK